MNRRLFLNHALSGALGGLCLEKSNLMASITRKRKLSKIGLQLYTVRREMEKDFDGTLAKVAALGFSEVEFAGYFNRTPQQVKSVLANNKLAAPSVHVLAAGLRGNLEQTIVVHVKDMDATPKRFFTEAGRGTINFKEILPTRKKPASSITL